MDHKQEDIDSRSVCVRISH